MHGTHCHSYSKAVTVACLHHVHHSVFHPDEACRYLSLYAIAHLYVLMDLKGLQLTIDKTVHLSPCLLQTLRDPATRALYDHQLSQAQLKATAVLHDEIELDEMDCTQQPDEAPSSNSSCQYTYACRCGDVYVLTTTDMELAAQTHQIIIPCR